MKTASRIAVPRTKRVANGYLLGLTYEKLGQVHKTGGPFSSFVDRPTRVELALSAFGSLRVTHYLLQLLEARTIIPTRKHKNENDFDVRQRQLKTDAPRRNGHREAGGKPEGHRAHHDGRQTDEHNGLPPDAVRGVAPNIRRQETAKRERARDVTGVVPCSFQFQGGKISVFSMTQSKASRSFSCRGAVFRILYFGFLR